MPYNDFRFFSYQSTSIQEPRGKDLEEKAFLTGFMYVLCLDFKMPISSYVGC